MFWQTECLVHGHWKHKKSGWDNSLGVLGVLPQKVFDRRCHFVCSYAFLHVVMTESVTEHSLVSRVCSGLSVAPQVCSQHVSTPPSHNTAVILLNMSRVEKQEFEEAGLFLNGGLLLFPS